MTWCYNELFKPDKVIIQEVLPKKESVFKVNNQTD